ncbi:MAG: hypothetical protein ACKOGP_07240 [Bacteroidota bacterium]
MKKSLILITLFFFGLVSSQVFSGPPSSCKPVLDGIVVEEITLEALTKWCDATPLIVQCDDGKRYALQTFQVNFFTLKPLVNREFGIGEGGIPLRAREAVAKGMTGDALILKEVKAADDKGNTISFPTMSFKLK